jgi:hypothetical protein
METKQMAEGKFHHPEIPDGLQIFEERLEVAGIGYRRDEARAFASGRGLTLAFDREPENQQDRNAIKIIGQRKTLFGSKRYFIGYVPRHVAAAIVEGNY